MIRRNLKEIICVCFVFVSNVNKSIYIYIYIYKLIEAVSVNNPYSSWRVHNWVFPFCVLHVLWPNYLCLPHLIQVLKIHTSYIRLYHARICWLTAKSSQNRQSTLVHVFCLFVCELHIIYVIFVITITW